MKYYHEYIDEINFRIIQEFDWGERRVVPATKQSYLDWINDGNVPEIISGDRFVSIINGIYIIDPDRDSIIESEKWESLRERSENDLKESEWMMLSDSALTTEQKTIAKEYRKKIMNLKKDYETADEAIAAFEALEKPDYKLW